MAAFGLPNFGQLTEAFRKAQQIQQDAQKLQEELNNMEIHGSNEDGRITIWVSGNQKPIKVEIDSELLIEGKEATEKAILQAMIIAYEKSSSTMKEKMEELTGGLNINLPGFKDENE